jgi:hypothetical protein
LIATIQIAAAVASNTATITPIFCHSESVKRMRRLQAGHRLALWKTRLPQPRQVTKVDSIFKFVVGMIPI